MGRKKDSPPQGGELSQGGTPAFLPRTGTTLRSIHPLGMRVLIRVRPDVDQTDSGLYLPEGAKQAKQQSMIGEVLEVAKATDEETDEEHNISGIPAGALVLVTRNAGVEVPWDESLRIVESKEILAMVSEVGVN